MQQVQVSSLSRVQEFKVLSLIQVSFAHKKEAWIFLSFVGKSTTRIKIQKSILLNKIINHFCSMNVIFFSDVTIPDSKEFKSLEGFVSEKTLNAIADMGFTTMMEIQYQSIVPLLQGR